MALYLIKKKKLQFALDLGAGRDAFIVKCGRKAI